MMTQLDSSGSTLWSPPHDLFWPPEQNQMVYREREIPSDMLVGEEELPADYYEVEEVHLPKEKHRLWADHAKMPFSWYLALYGEAFLRKFIRFDRDGYPVNPGIFLGELSKHQSVRGIKGLYRAIHLAADPIFLVEDGNKLYMVVVVRKEAEIAGESLGEKTLSIPGAFTNPVVSIEDIPTEGSETPLQALQRMFDEFAIPGGMVDIQDIFSLNSFNATGFTLSKEFGEETLETEAVESGESLIIQPDEWQIAAHKFFCHGDDRMTYTSSIFADVGYVLKTMEEFKRFVLKTTMDDKSTKFPHLIELTPETMQFFALKHHPILVQICIQHAGLAEKFKHLMVPIIIN